MVVDDGTDLDEEDVGGLGESVEITDVAAAEKNRQRRCIRLLRPLLFC